MEPGPASSRRLPAVDQADLAVADPERALPHLAHRRVVRKPRRADRAAPKGRAAPAAVADPVVAQVAEAAEEAVDREPSLSS